MPLNDNGLGNEELLSRRHRERKGWRRADIESGNSEYLRVPKKGKLD